MNKKVIFNYTKANFVISEKREECYPYVEPNEQIISIFVSKFLPHSPYTFTSFWKNLILNYETILRILI